MVFYMKSALPLLPLRYKSVESPEVAACSDKLVEQNVSCKHCRSITLRWQNQHVKNKDSLLKVDSRKWGAINTWCLKNYERHTRHRGQLW